MEAYHERTGERLTYALLAERSGLARATLESIATRSGYNATLDAVARLCAALDCTPAMLLQLQARAGSRGRKGKRRRLQTSRAAPKD